MKYIKSIIVSLVLMVFSVSSYSQCSEDNQAFKSGEFLSYNLYYNWKFIWVKAGTASMKTILSRYHGKPAYKGGNLIQGLAGKVAFDISDDKGGHLDADVYLVNGQDTVVHSHT